MHLCTWAYVGSEPCWWWWEAWVLSGWLGLGNCEEKKHESHWNFLIKKRDWSSQNVLAYQYYLVDWDLRKFWLLFYGAWVLKRSWSIWLLIITIFQFRRRKSKKNSILTCIRHKISTFIRNSTQRLKTWEYYDVW